MPPDAKEPNALIYLAYLGVVLLGVGLLVLGACLIRGRHPDEPPGEV